MPTVRLRLTVGSWSFVQLESNTLFLSNHDKVSASFYPPSEIFHQKQALKSYEQVCTVKHFMLFRLYSWASLGGSGKYTTAYGDERHVIKSLRPCSRLLWSQLCWSQVSWERRTCIKHFYCWANQPWLPMQICREMNEESRAWKVHRACACFCRVNTAEIGTSEEKLSPDTLLVCSLRKWEFRRRLHHKLFICSFLSFYFRT